MDVDVDVVVRKAAAVVVVDHQAQKGSWRGSIRAHRP